MGFEFKATWSLNIRGIQGFPQVRTQIKGPWNHPETESLEECLGLRVLDDELFFGTQNPKESFRV